MKKILLLSLFLALTLNSCFTPPDTITAPNWDVDLNLPLTNRHYVMEDIINTDSRLTIGAGNIYQIQYDTVSKKQGIAEFIKDRLNYTYSNVEIPISTSMDGTILIEFANSVYLDSAFFNTGNITLEVKNPSATKLKFELTIPGFTKGTTKMSTVADVSPNQTQTVVIDMADYGYSSGNQAEKNKMLIQGKILEGENNNKVVINVKIDKTNFRYVAGKLPATEINSFEKSESLPLTEDIKGFRGKITFNDASLVITGSYISALLANDTHKPFDLRMTTINIVGKRKDGTFINLTDKAGNKELGPVTTVNNVLTLPYNNSNSNISEFLSYMPDSIKIITKATINPENKSGAATDRDSIQFAFDMKIKSDIRIDKATYSDTMSISEGDNKLDEDTRETIRDARWVKLSFKVNNRIPLEAKLVADFMGTNKTKLFSIDTVSFAGASLNALGEPISDTYSLSEVVLDSAQIDMLSKADRIITHLTMSSTSSSNAKLNSKDWIKVISYLSVKYHIDPDKDKDKDKK